MNTFLTIDEIRKAYPEEWVLLGEPKIVASSILGGIVVFHAPTKQGLLAGRDSLKNFEHSTWTFTGEKKRGMRQWVSIYRQVPQKSLEK